MRVSRVLKSVLAILLTLCMLTACSAASGSSSTAQSTQASSAASSAASTSSMASASSKEESKSTSTEDFSKQDPYTVTIVGLNKEHYEAAAIDGAGRWKRIWYITLPELKPTIVILTLMSVGRIFYSDFGLFYQVPMNSGPLIDVTNTIDTYVYRGLMQSQNIGMSSAAGFYQSIMGFLLILLSNLIVRKVDENSALF
jgi:hypothetical protein